jgi:hypothetical protein
MSERGKIWHSCCQQGKGRGWGMPYTAQPISVFSSGQSNSRGAGPGRINSIFEGEDGSGSKGVALAGGRPDGAATVKATVDQETLTSLKGPAS